MVESLIHRAKLRHGFSAADLSDPLLVDYAEVGLAAVGRDVAEIRGRLDKVLAAAENSGEMVFLSAEELPFPADVGDIGTWGAGGADPEGTT